VPNDSIVLVPYASPEWARRFQAERALLERILAPRLEDGIHHIGSTAIPGIAAKPIIDMIAGVRDLEEARAAFHLLREHDYLLHPTGRTKHTISPSRRSAWGSSTGGGVAGLSGEKNGVACAGTASRVPVAAPLSCRAPGPGPKDPTVTKNCIGCSRVVASTACSRVRLKEAPKWLACAGPR
jgi:GrpB protein